MKSFSKFLEESYLSEAGVPDDYEEYMRKYSGTPKKLAQMSDADFNARFENNPKMNVARDIGKQQSRPARRRKPSQSVEQLKADIAARDAEKAARRAQRGPTGAAADPSKQFKPQVKTTTVASPARKPSGGALVKTSKSVALAKTPPIEAVNVRDVTKPKGKLPSGTKGATLTTRSSSTPAKTPPIEAVNVRDVTPKAPKLPAASSAAKEAEKAAAKTATKTAGKGILKGLVKIAGPASAALDVADERSKGSGWARSLAKGAVVAAGGALGGTAGSVAGPVGTVGGAVGGSMAASKAFDTVAGKNAKERAADRMANRQRQAGSSIKGIGGPTSFDTKKNTMTTGSGAQRKTVQLAKTGVVQRGGKSVAGDLAFKTDSKGQKQAVYKAPPAPGTGSKNPLERIGRSLFAGAYKQSDAANAAKKLAAARQSDAARNKALGVKALPGK